jgi:hypothetical protein
MTAAGPAGLRAPLEPIDLRDLEALDRYAARQRRLLALR